MVCLISVNVILKPQQSQVLRKTQRSGTGEERRGGEEREGEGVVNLQTEVLGFGLWVLGWFFFFFQKEKSTPLKRYQF